MITLKIIDGKLAVVKGRTTIIEPFSAEINEAGEVWIKGLTTDSEFYDYYENFQNADEEPFGDANEILTFIAPYLGFKTATGGSVAVHSSAELLKTGITTSYLPGDDGALQQGRGIDFFTLEEPNIFGNTNRFTDTNGLQVYGDFMVLDHQTNDGVNILGYLKEIVPSDSMGFQLAYINLIPGLKMVNINQLMNICNWGEYFDPLNYAPFNIDVGLITGIRTNSMLDSVSSMGISSVYTGAFPINDNFESMACRYIPISELI